MHTAALYALLQAAFSKLPKASLLQLEGPASQAEPWAPDMRVSLLFGGHERVLAVKWLSPLQPRQAHLQQLSMRDWLAKNESADAYGILAAPFISAETQRILISNGVGALDSAGNTQLHLDNLCLVTECATNPARERREVRSLFTPKAASILRVLLNSPLKAWRGVDLAKLADASMGHVSNVRRELVDQAWAENTPDGLRLTQPEAILRAWARVPMRDLEWRNAYTILHGKQLVDKLEHCQRQANCGVLLAGATAAARVAPYLRNPSLTLLVNSRGLAELETELSLKTLSGTQLGGNVSLLVTDESTYFSQAASLPDSSRSTDWVTTYLVMMQQGERSQEAAEHLLEEKLRPMWAQLVESVT